MYSWTRKVELSTFLAGVQVHQRQAPQAAHPDVSHYVPEAQTAAVSFISRLSTL